MNLEAEIQSQGIACQQAVAGYTFVVLKTGIKFPGRITDQSIVDPLFPLGSDPREKSILYALRKDVPNDLISLLALSQVLISQLDSDGNELGTWAVTKRIDNPADPNETSFELLKVTGLDI